MGLAGLHRGAGAALKFVRMRGQSDSAIACLAMVAGIGYVDAAMVLYEGGPYKPATQSCILSALCRAGIDAASPMRTVYGWAEVPQPSIVRALLDATDTYWHWVVLAQGMVFDPGLVAPVRSELSGLRPLSFISLESAKVPARCAKKQAMSSASNSSLSSTPKNGAAHCGHPGATRMREDAGSRHHSSEVPA